LAAAVEVEAVTLPVAVEPAVTDLMFLAKVREVAQAPNQL
jgi:hypothetical protein